MKNLVVIYHANCPDGFGGAWVAWKKFGDQAEYIKAHHSDSPPADLKNKEIYFIDFVYSLEITNKILRKNNKVVIIDHHISAENIVKLASDYSFDINHSGSILAWKYFFPKKNTPRLLQHIEDIDIWKFAMPFTKEISLVIGLYDFDFKTWDKLAEEIEDEQTRNRLIDAGKIILRNDQKIVERLLEGSTDLVKFEGYQTLIMNFPNEHYLHSVIGNALCFKKPPIGVVWSEFRGRKYFSLRSDGTVDVSKIAQKYSGGGHKAAAGFSIPADQPLPWKVIQKP